MCLSGVALCVTKRRRDTGYRGLITALRFFLIGNDKLFFFCWQIHILLISYPWRSSILLLSFCYASRGGNGVYKGGGMQAFCHPFSSACFPLLLFLLWSYHSAGCLGFTHHIPLFDWEQHYSLDYSFNLCSAIYFWCLSSSTHFLSYFLPISILLIQVSTSWFLF